MKRERADLLVVRRGLAESCQKAQALIMAGLVFAGGERVEKPGQRIDKECHLILKERKPYVSRGGVKLEEALDIFKVEVRGRTAADLGASTGGFTDCLLQRGAGKVFAVDVDIKQLDWRLRQDNRVVCIEKNARYLREEDFGETLDLVTTDLSFISIRKVLPAVLGFIGNGTLLTLLKPQFEVGQHQVGKKGIVKNPKLHQEVMRKIITDVESLGFTLKGLIKSSVPGAKGNREFFSCWRVGEEALGHEEQQRLIKEAVWDEKN